ncbi:MAG: 6,7-dimethyl-8-ribityllumazine synthase [Betaproteobacteria bacterium]|nr:MAG: 6,7-dimethyl-8-ribityllumazine synthase [Betaproteobacteria bacterium]
MPVRNIAPNTRAGHLRVGIVVSQFNAEIGEALLHAALGALDEAGVPSDAITVARVPGALESPLALQRMAQTDEYDALVALGAVIRGETYHFEIVANESAAGLASVQLEFGIPIGNGILTTDTEEQASARAQSKGRDAVLAALEMANLLEAIDEQ